MKNYHFQAPKKLSKRIGSTALIVWRRSTTRRYCFLCLPLCCLFDTRAASSCTLHWTCQASISHIARFSSNLRKMLGSSVGRSSLFLTSGVSPPQPSAGSCTQKKKTCWGRGVGVNYRPVTNTACLCPTNLSIKNMLEITLEFHAVNLITIYSARASLLY